MNTLRGIALIWVRVLWVYAALFGLAAAFVVAWYTSAAAGEWLRMSP